MFKFDVNFFDGNRILVLATGNSHNVLQYNV